jgi:hypothetical protein
MAKKNFDDFINAAGKKPKLSPEEVEAMAKQLHQPAAEPAEVSPPAAQPKAPKTPPQRKAAPVAKQKTAKAKAAQGMATASREAAPPEAPKEKVRITIDLAKDLYKRMKLSVVHNETEISAYIRSLIEEDLAKQ